MERLTFEGNFCDIALCTNTRGGSFCEDGYCSQHKVWERLKYFEDLQEQGRLVELPCKAGDTVFSLWSRVDSEKQYIRSAVITERNLHYYLMQIRNGSSFVTRDEAQAARHRMEGQESKVKSCGNCKHAERIEGKNETIGCTESQLLRSPLFLCGEWKGNGTCRHIDKLKELGVDV